MYAIIKASRMEVFDNRTLRLTPEQVKARTGCTHVINGYFFNGKFQPLGWTVIDGKIISRDAYQDWGISAGSDGKPRMLTDRGGSFLSGVPLLKNGAKLKRNLTPDVARPAERTAVGWMPDGRVLIWCDKMILTREQLQDKLLSLECVDGLMLDGGGSTQGVFPASKVVSSRKVSTMLCFWAETEETKEDPKVETKKKVCLDAGHSASNKVNKSPDGTYFEHEFALDMAKRIKAHLECYGVEVVETRPDGGDVSLGERCRISNAAKPDLFVSLHSNATGTLSTGSDGWGNARGWECYVYGLSGARYKAAKTILASVEGVAPAIRSTPILAKPGLYVLAHTSAPAVLIEHGFHTSREDVAYLKDSAYREKLAAAEARGILEYFGIAWKEVSELDAAVDKLAAAGIIDSPDRWKKLDFTENSVRLLIIKMAAALK